MCYVLCSITTFKSSRIVQKRPEVQTEVMRKTRVHLFRLNIQNKTNRRGNKTGSLITSSQNNKSHTVWFTYLSYCILSQFAFQSIIHSHLFSRCFSSFSVCSIYISSSHAFSSCLCRARAHNTTHSARSPNYGVQSAKGSEFMREKMKLIQIFFMKSHWRKIEIVLKLLK